MLTEPNIEPITALFKRLPDGKQNMARYFQGVRRQANPESASDASIGGMFQGVRAGIFVIV
jgi:hypothetical protein